MRGDVGEVVVMCGGCFCCCVRVDLWFVLGRVWAWADFVMCDRRGGVCALCLRTLHVFFYRRGTSAKGGTQKAHNVYYV